MRADRLLSLIVLLQGGSVRTALDIAGEMEVSVRTVYRDMESLQRMGVPVTATAGPNGGYSVMPGYRTVLSGFKPEEIAALTTAAGAADMEDLGMQSTLKTALRKLAAYHAPTAPTVELDPDRVLLDGTPWSPTDRRSVLTALTNAIAVRRIVTLETRALPHGGLTIRRMAEPYGIVHKVNRWFLVYRTGTYRVVTMDQIRSVEPTDHRYAPDPAFDLVGFWEQWCREFMRRRLHYPVTLAVQKQYASAVKAVLAGASAAVLTGPEPGRPRASSDGEEEIDAMFEGFADARAAILGLGGAARIISPEPLRASVADFARQTLRANGGV